MASIIQVNGKWRAQVRRKGFPPETKTFGTKILAERWARKLEAGIDAGRAGLQTSGGAISLGKLIKRYNEEVGGAKPFAKNKVSVLRFIDDWMGTEDATKLTPDRLVRYLTEERRVTGVTANLDLVYIRAVLRIARALWKNDVHPSVVDDAREIMRQMGMSVRSNERDRRPTEKELTALRGWFETHPGALTPDHFDFILDSCFRPPSEIGRLRWEDLNRKDRTIVIRDRKDPKKKIGNNQTVPLLGRCMEIINRQPYEDGDETIFHFNGETWSQNFARAVKKLKIVDLHMYDLRHEAISRLVETGKYSIPEMMLITGHKDPKMLMRYTQLRAKDLHR